MIAMSGDIYVSQEYLKAHFDGSLHAAIKTFKERRRATDSGIVFLPCISL
jgi:hypothetical protein